MAHKVVTLIIICLSLTAVGQVEIVDVLETDENTINASDDYLSQEASIDLNRVDEEELTACGLFSPSEVSALVNHRDRFGQFLSVYELLHYLERPERLHEIKAYVRCERTRLKAKPKNQVLARVTAREVEAGHVDLSVRSRMTVSIDNQLSFRLLVERDAGELWLNKNEYPDHVSGALKYMTNKGIKLVAGDYRVNLGCGLLLGSMFGVGKSYSVYSLYRPPITLQALATGNEFDYHRGLAIHRPRDKSTITAFLSVHDYNVTGATDSSFRGFDLSGVHLPTGAQSSVQTTGAGLVGLSWTYRNKQLELGAHGYGVQFTKKYEPRIDIYNVNTSQFNRNGKLGLFMKRSLSGGFAFGEFALDYNRNYAFIGGVLSSLGPRWNFGVVYRSIAPGFFSFHNRFFSEFSSGDNEQGCFAQLTGKLNRNWSVSISNDVFRRHWFERNQSPFDVFTEQQFEVSYLPSKRTMISWRWSKNRPSSSSNIGERQALTPTQKFRFQLRSELNTSLRYQFRYNAAWQELGKGMKHSSLLYHDIRWSPAKKLRITARIQFAQIPNYDLRLYAFENDVLYQFSVPGSFEDHIRSYLLLLYKPIQALRFEIKLSTNTTVMREDKSVFINRMLNRSSDIRVQIVWTWE